MSRRTACNALAHAMRNGNDAHRCFAVEALGEIGCAGALDDVIACLRDEDPDVRTSAAQALGRLGNARAGTALLETLIDDPDGEVKAKAIEALGAIGYSDAIPVLRQLVTGRAEDRVTWDEDAYYSEGWDDWLDVQVEAITALGKLMAETAAHEIATAMLDEAAQDLEAVGTNALGRIGGQGIEMLKSFIAAGRPVLQRAAVRALAEAAASGATDSLLAALEDSEAGVRQAALKALAEIAPDHPHLVEMRDIGPDENRAYLIAKLPGATADQLATWFAEGSSIVRAAALERLAEDRSIRIDKELRHALIDACFASEDVVAAAAVNLLGLRFSGATVGLLSAVLQDAARPGAVKQAAVDALAAVGTESALEPLILAAGSDRRDLRFGAIRGMSALAKSGQAGPRPLQALHQAFHGDLLDIAELERPDEAPESDIDATGDSDTGGGDLEIGTPTSTLDAILNPEVDSDDGRSESEHEIELSDEDLDYLALARSGLGGRGRVVLEPNVAPAEDVRQLAARMLGDFSDRETINHLSNALDSTEPGLCLAAIESLLEIGHRGTRLPATTGVALAALFGHTDILIRYASMRCLRFCRGKKACDASKGSLDSNDPYMRVEALRSFAELGGEIRRIRDALGDEEPTVRSAAARALANRNDRNVVDDLFAFALDRDNAREAAALLASQHRVAATRRFAAVLMDADRRRLWRAAIEALETLHASTHT